MASKRLTIALVGATGNSGIQMMNLALDRGHVVKALVRAPGKISVQHENLMVVESNVLDTQSLAEGFKGCDVVISCLGMREKMPKGTSFYLDTMKIISTAMKENNMKRIIVMSSWGTYRDSRSPYFIEYFFRFIIAQTLNSMREMELYLEQECTELDYTVVRPPGLNDNPPSGRPIKVEEECPCVPQGWCDPNFMISRADVATFMLDTAETNAHTRKCVSIAV